LRRAITNVVFAKVDCYKRNIVYDHFKNGRCEYVDDAEEVKKYSKTLVLPVVRYPNDVTELILKTIIKSLTSEGKAS